MIVCNVKNYKTDYRTDKIIDWISNTINPFSLVDANAYNRRERREVKSAIK